MGPDRIARLFLMPHLVNAVLVIVVLTIATAMVMKRGRENASLRTPAITLHILLLIQVMLGVGAFATRVVWHLDVPQPQAALVWTTVAHQTTGALMLLAAVVLAIQTRRALVSRIEFPERKFGTRHAVIA